MVGVGFGDDLALVAPAIPEHLRYAAREPAHLLSGFRRRAAVVWYGARRGRRGSAGGGAPGLEPKHVHHPFHEQRGDAFELQHAREVVRNAGG